jgi:hypothetical protein
VPGTTSNVEVAVEVVCSTACNSNPNSCVLTAFMLFTCDDVCSVVCERSSLSSVVVISNNDQCCTQYRIVCCDKLLNIMTMLALQCTPCTLYINSYMAVHTCVPFILNFPGIWCTVFTLDVC